MSTDKREARRKYKEREAPPKGVFAVRSARSGRVWVSGSRNLPASRTGLFFMLRNSSHHNKEMQADWEAHGEESFSFEVVETFDPEIPDIAVRDALRDRPRHWAGVLDATAI
jgi:hypothetical protein